VATALVIGTLVRTQRVGEVAPYDRIGQHGPLQTSVPTFPLPHPTTPPPDPSAFVAAGGRIATGSLDVVPSPPSHPTPTPDPEIWRFEGVVVDEAGDGIPGVCVIIGPHGCQPGSIRTNEDGRYWIDVPQKATVVYDLYFAKEGYQVVWYRAQPDGPTRFNVLLRRT
jgi:hypothetical protein